MKPNDIEIIRFDRVTHGEYVAQTGDGSRAGKLTWTLRGEARDAEHTIVPPEMHGRGIAGKLVDALIRDAKREGFAIIPSCSYVAKQFERHPEWEELRA
jgi:hypothetical protein